MNILKRKCKNCQSTNAEFTYNTSYHNSFKANYNRKLVVSRIIPFYAYYLNLKSNPCELFKKKEEPAIALLVP